MLKRWIDGVCRPSVQCFLQCPVFLSFGIFLHAFEGIDQFDFDVLERVNNLDFHVLEMLYNFDLAAGNPAKLIKMITA